MLNLRYAETRIIYTWQVIGINTTESLDQAKINILFQRERKETSIYEKLKEEWEKKQRNPLIYPQVFPMC